MFRDYLVTDRTPADVARGKYLLSLFDASGVWRGSQAQLRELESSRGFCTAADLNRVERAVAWLHGRLWRYGYTDAPPETGAVLIDVVVTPPGTGTAAGGLFYVGETVTLTALPQGGSRFSAWTEGGETVSTSASYTFPADQDRRLTAVFEPVDEERSGVVGFGRVGTAIVGRSL